VWSLTQPPFRAVCRALGVNYEGWPQGEKAGGGTEVRLGQAGLERRKGSTGHTLEGESPGLGDQVDVSKG